MTATPFVKASITPLFSKYFLNSCFFDSGVWTFDEIKNITFWKKKKNKNKQLKHNNSPPDSWTFCDNKRKDFFSLFLFVFEWEVKKPFHFPWFGK